MRPCYSLFAFVVAAIPATAFAQSATSDTDVIKLSEFNVSANQAGGYRATNSITATGIDTKLSDAPVAINVLTSDFLKDLGQQRLTDALVYVPGVMNASYESNIQIRGFNGQQLYRNGFYRRQTYTTWNIDRVEVIKGAAAVFYGILRPGGVINYLTSKPSFEGNFTEATLAFGSDAYTKAAVYTNVKAGPSLALRLGLGTTDGGAWRNNDFNRQSYQGLAGTWRIAPNHELTVELEHIYWKFTDLRGIDLSLTNRRYYGNADAIASGLNVSQWVAANSPAGTPTYDSFVPESANPKGRRYVNGSDTWSEQESDTIDVIYRAKLSHSLVFTSTANFARDFFEEERTISNDQSPFADGTINYQFGHFGNTRHSFNFNNKLAWRFEIAGTKNTMQFGQEYLHLIQMTPGIFTVVENFQDGFRSASFRESPAASARRSGVTALAATGIVFDTQRQRIDDFRAYYLMNQQELFASRLHLLYGLRYNDVDRHVVYSRSVGNREPVSSARKTTPEFGALYKLTEGLSAFATYTKSLEVPFGADVTGRPIDPVDDTGLDLGFKTTLLDGRLSSTVSYYETKRDHIATNDTARQNATGQAPFFIYDNTAESRGLEADVNLSLTDGLSLMLGWSHDLQNKITRSTNAAQVGLPLGGVPKDFFTLWSRYDFNAGELKGFFIAGGFRASTSARVSTDQVGLSLDNVTVRSGFVVWDGMAGYRFKAAGRPVTATLSVKNVLDRVYREGVDGGWAPPRQIQVSFTTKF